MNLINRIRDYFSPPAPPTLRNKPGGMAWIKRFDEDIGAGVMAGRVVKTVAISSEGFWTIDPPQPWTVTESCVYGGIWMDAGTRVLSVSIADRQLEPINDVGDGVQDESLRYLPPVPTDTKAPKGVPA